MLQQQQQQQLARPFCPCARDGCLRQHEMKTPCRNVVLPVGTRSSVPPRLSHFRSDMLARYTRETRQRKGRERGREDWEESADRPSKREGAAASEKEKIRQKARQRGSERGAATRVCKCALTARSRQQLRRAADEGESASEQASRKEQTQPQTRQTDGQADRQKEEGGGARSRVAQPVDARCMHTRSTDAAAHPVLSSRRLPLTLASEGKSQGTDALHHSTFIPFLLTLPHRRHCHSYPQRPSLLSSRIWRIDNIARRAQYVSASQARRHLYVSSSRISESARVHFAASPPFHHLSCVSTSLRACHGQPSRVIFLVLSTADCGISDASYSLVDPHRALTRITVDSSSAVHKSPPLNKPKGGEKKKNKGGKDCASPFFSST